jgi:hypothetical protein
MRMLDARATELFNRILKEWRGQGRRIDWEELRQAAAMAQADQEARGAEGRQGPGKDREGGGGR